MTLPINLERAVRGYADQVALIRAVVGAPESEPETDYLEWKSAANIRERDWRVEAARHILGFANRDPEGARTALEGCAYLILGAAPRILTGTAAYDPADVHKWVTKYTGDDLDSPRFRFDFVPVDSTAVLLFTIEPPKPGDPPFSFRKDYRDFRDGDIWVRKAGRTERANTRDQLRLAARARAAHAGLSADVSIRPGGAAASLDTSDEALERWRTTERDLYLDKFRRGPGGELGGMFMADTRSPDEFERELREYIGLVKAALPGEMCRAMIADGAGAIQVRVQNEVGDAFANAVLELTLDSSVKAFLDEDDVSGEPFPDRPEPWGKLHFGTLHFPELGSLGAGSSERRGVALRVDDDGRTIIELGPFHLRPHSTVEPHEFFVFVDAAAAESNVVIPWRLMADGVRGDLRGELIVDVAPSAIRPEQLVPFRRQK